MEQTQNTDTRATNENCLKPTIRMSDAASAEKPSEQTVGYFNI